MTKTAKIILSIIVLLLSVKALSGTLQDIHIFSDAYAPLDWDNFVAGIRYLYLFLDVFLYIIAIIGLGLRSKIGWCLLLLYPLVMMASPFIFRVSFHQVILGLLIAILLLTKPILKGFGFIEE